MQAGNWRWLLSFGILLDPWLHLYCWLGFLFASHNVIIFFLMYNFYLLLNIIPIWERFLTFNRVEVVAVFVQAKRTWMVLYRVTCSWSATRLHSNNFAVVLEYLCFLSISSWAEFKCLIMFRFKILFFLWCLNEACVWVCADWLFVIFVLKVTTMRKRIVKVVA